MVGMAAFCVVVFVLERIYVRASAQAEVSREGSEGSEGSEEEADIETGERLESLPPGRIMQYRPVIAASPNRMMLCETCGAITVRSIAECPRCGGKRFDIDDERVSEALEKLRGGRDTGEWERN